ncbi:hypothetical protein VNO77_27083 [Canavalia gladiata]|uniref:Uncharacterized protein n=1 Tax=Canavalia gladiata TaxID=3824 RepID=A0AAN9KX71_CANGL
MSRTLITTGARQPLLGVCYMGKFGSFLARHHGHWHGDGRSDRVYSHIDSQTRLVHDPLKGSTKPRIQASVSLSTVTSLSYPVVCVESFVLSPTDFSSYSNAMRLGLPSGVMLFFETARSRLQAAVAQEPL